MGNFDFCNLRCLVSRVHILNTQKGRVANCLKMSGKREHTFALQDFCMIRASHILASKAETRVKVQYIWKFLLCSDKDKLRRTDLKQCRPLKPSPVSVPKRT